MSLAKKKLKKIYFKHLAEVNASLDNHERIAKFVIMQESWTVENNLITPTMKVKRNILEKKYEDDFLKWQSKKDMKVIWE
jgi:long-chain acyl-CoA synthetase